VAWLKREFFETENPKFKIMVKTKLSGCQSNPNWFKLGVQASIWIV